MFKTNIISLKVIPRWYDIINTLINLFMKFSMDPTPCTLHIVNGFRVVFGRFVENGWKFVKSHVWNSSMIKFPIQGELLCDTFEVHVLTENYLRLSFRLRVTRKNNQIIITTINFKNIASLSLAIRVWTYCFMFTVIWRAVAHIIKSKGYLPVEHTINKYINNQPIVRYCLCLHLWHVCITW